ncbi:hypothetical protein FACS1894159_09270 [Bacteroidia bacterium]|nr:hypothetical protein FACS1894159_09270 [Bacteroidia bacterium]
MKNTIRIIFVLLAACGSASLLGARETEQEIAFRPAEYKVPSATFFRNGSTVYVAFDIVVPAHCLRSGEALVITPQIDNGSHSVILPSISLEGYNYRMIRRAKTPREQADDPHTYLTHIAYRGRQVTLHYQTSVLYTDKMNGSKLYAVRETVSCCGRGGTLIAPVQRRLLNGTAITSTTQSPAPAPPAQQESWGFGDSYTENFGNRSVFKLNSEEIDPAVLKGAYAAFVDKVKRMTHKGATLTNIFVNTTASPEGLVSRNAELALQRGKVMSNMIVKDLGVDPSMVVMSDKAENWDGLEAAVEVSDLPNKKQVLNVIRTVEPLEERKAALKRLDNYQAILDIIYTLRNCTVTVFYITKE